MLRASFLALGIVLWGQCRLGTAAQGVDILAVGAWSKPVADMQGYRVRGRLLLGEKRFSPERREVAVYLELQDANDFLGNAILLFCDLGKSDFRPQAQGLHCELRDRENRPVATTPFAFSGAVPKSEWVSLSRDATVRLRCSPFGIYRPGAMAISPHLGALWVIEEADRNPYFLSGTFDVKPEADRAPSGEGHIWRGKIELPAVRVEHSSSVIFRERSVPPPPASGG